MQCPYPLLIKNPRFLNGDIKADPFLSVPCGKCEVCRYNDSLEWRVRLLEEFNNSFNCFFITLTYNDDKLPFKKRSTGIGYDTYVPCVSLEDVQKFLKRFRFHIEKLGKKQGYKYLEKFKYFIVSEYGPTTLRPHYHALFFNIDGYDPNNQVSIIKLQKKIAEIWDNGYVDVSVANSARINYVTKYMFGFSDLPEGYVKPFRLMSRRPAIGINYLNRSESIKWHKKGNNFISIGEYKFRMPRYFKNKIYTEDELKKLSEKIRHEQIEKMFDLPYDQIMQHLDLNSDDIEMLRCEYLHFRNKNFCEQFKEKFKKNRKL